MSTWADRVARAWVRCYTQRLPVEVAERRRAEIRSDVYEHGAMVGRSAVQQIHVFGRVLWGIPADLSWRRAARAPRERRLATGDTMTLKKTSMAVIAFAALLNVFLALGVGIGLGAEDADAAGGVRWGLPLLLAAALIIYALRTREDAPRRSTVLIVIGAGAPMLVLYWMAPLFVPFWLLVIALAVASEPRRRAPRPAAT